MSGNRFYLGGSTKDKERPIITSQSDKKVFVKALSGYLTSMQERCPDVNHPPMDWLTKGFSMIALDQDQSVSASRELSSLDTVKEEVRHELQAFL